MPLPSLLLCLACERACDLLSMSAVCRDWYRASHALARFLPDEAQLVALSGSTAEILAWLRDGTLKCWKLHTHLNAFRQEWKGLRGDCDNDKAILSLLANAHSLSLGGSSWKARNGNLTDVRTLGSVCTLNLSRCYRLVDVRALGSVRTLDLSNCEILDDVSALGSVYALDLSFCPNVVDVSALGGAHTST